MGTLKNVFAVCIKPHYRPVAGSMRCILTSIHATCASRRYSTVDQAKVTSQSDCISASDETTKLLMEKFMRVYDDFINENEEQSMYDEVHPYLRRLRYEFDHWDDVSEHAGNSLCLACIIEGHLFTWTHVNGCTIALQSRRWMRMLPKFGDIAVLCTGSAHQVRQCCQLWQFLVVSQRHEDIILGLSQWASLWLLGITTSRLSSTVNWWLMHVAGPRATPIRHAACIFTVYCLNIPKISDFTAVWSKWLIVYVAKICLYMQILTRNTERSLSC